MPISTTGTIFHRDIYTLRPETINGLYVSAGRVRRLMHRYNNKILMVRLKPHPTFELNCINELFTFHNSLKKEQVGCVV